MLTERDDIIGERAPQCALTNARPVTIGLIGLTLAAIVLLGWWIGTR